jgi:hypothetical protein
MVMELSEVLNGPGGYLEQTSAYLEHQSALQYLRMANEPGYSTLPIGLGISSSVRPRSSMTTHVDREWR